MQLLNGAEILEGILGGIGTYYILIYKQKASLSSTIVRWCLFWFFRKIGVRIYRNYVSALNIKSFEK